MSTTRIKIGKEEDRLTVANILVKNGYTVRIIRVKRETGKSYDFYLEFNKTEE